MSNADQQDDFEKEIKDLFLIEASDLLDQAEAYLLTLEKNSADSEAFDALLRMMHNLKGSGKAVGFDEISKFSHQVENVLVAVRAGKVLFTTKVVGLMLKCCDRLKQDIILLKSDVAAPLDHQELYQQLTSTLEARPEEAHDALAEITEAHFQEAPTPIKQKPQLVVANNHAPSEEFVRISLKKIEDLLNNFGEAVILQATLDHVKYNLSEHHELALKTINQLSKLTYDLQQTTIALRMVSLKQVFSKMERTARDTAVSVAKKIQFISEGQENELDKSIVDAVSDPLTHMIRNAVDHGLETEEERIAKGKDPCGKIVLNGFRRGGFFYITIQDDGRGLDKDKILAKAIKQGLVRSDEKLSDSEIYDLIYANGFSTRETASDISGRGVGMNVVKESIQALKGTCTIESKLGEGTCFTIRLPLTLAIFNGMVVKIAENLYIIPNSDVESVAAMPADGGRYVSEGKEKVIEVGDVVMPLINLREKLKTGSDALKIQQRITAGTLVITHTGGTPHAMLVDEVVAQQRVVHKTLGPEVNHQVKGAAGATILGDGSPALILDISALLPLRERVA